MNAMLLSYYHEELIHLRRLSEEFHNSHPDIPIDPSITHLLDAVALLAARIHYQIDDDFSLVTQNLLQILYPHFNRPLPACGIIQFFPYSHLKSKQVINSHTLLLSRHAAAAYRLRTTMPITIHPWSITNSRLSDDRLMLTLQCNDPATTIKHFMPTKLVLYINTNPEHSYDIYSLFTYYCERLKLINPDSNKSVNLDPKHAINPIAFEQAHGLFPYPKQSFSGYQLLTEYFHFPEKFLFIQIDLPAEFIQNLSKSLTIEFHTTQRKKSLEKHITHNTFALHCTPVTNLFTTQSKPFLLTHYHSKYPLSAEKDSKHPHCIIYSIDSMTAISKQGRVLKLHPYHGNKFDQSQQTPLYWNEYRTQNQLSISFIDPQQILNEEQWTISAEITCLNETFHLHDNLQLWNSELDYIEKITAIHKTVPPVITKEDIHSQWPLISHLALSNFFTERETQDANVLRELLHLYNFSGCKKAKQIIDAIIQFSSQPITIRHPKTPGFYAGLIITLTINESAFPNKNWLLLMPILNHFFRLYCSINTVTQLIVYNLSHEEIYRCLPQLGNQPML